MKKFSVSLENINKVSLTDNYNLTNQNQNKVEKNIILKYILTFIQ